MFDASYSDARARFLQAAESVQVPVESIQIAALGPDGDRLAIDVATIGADRPKRALIHISGMHGIDGFAGSAVQCAFLNRLPRVHQEDAILLVHISNPYGMAWLRRVNSNNVDLNRNCLSTFAQVSGTPADYSLVDWILNSQRRPWIGVPFKLKMLWRVRKYGRLRIRHIVAGGQYVNPRGLFYGGSELEEEPKALFALLCERLERAEVAAVIVIDTGNGPFGTANHTSIEHPAGSFFAGQDTSRGTPPIFATSGDFSEELARMHPHIHWTRICQEFGTYSFLENLKSLVDENCWHHRGRPIRLNHPVKRRLREAFNPNDGEWRRMVVDEGILLIENIYATRIQRELPAESLPRH
jgi:hypothetical protein